MMIFFEDTEISRSSPVMIASYSASLLEAGKFKRMACFMTRENSNFWKKGKIVISVKIRNFSRSRMMKRISLLESSHEI